MKQEYEITNQLGLHVMPAKRIALAAEQFDCEMTMTVKGRAANPKKMIEIVKLGVKKGDVVILETIGKDEEVAQRVIGALLTSG